MKGFLKDSFRRLAGDVMYGKARAFVHRMRSREWDYRKTREREQRRTLDLKRRFKGYVIESLKSRRMLERDLARMRHPELYSPELGVVLEVSELRSPMLPSSGSVSIVITNFNYGSYISQAIGSVLRQTQKQVEIVVVDDASSDGSPLQITQELEHVSSIPWQFVGLQHNVGLPAARNIGVKLARGEFIFILDADNHLLPRCIEDHVRAAEQGSADAAYGMIRTFGSVSILLSDEQFSAETLAHGPYIDAMALFRKSSLLEIGLYATEPALYGWEDYELWVRLAAQEKQVVFIPSVLSHYRYHHANMISVASLDTRGAWRYLFATYPQVFGAMSNEEQESEAERRALRVGRSADSAFERQSGVPVKCDCVGLGEGQTSTRLDVVDAGPSR